MKRVIILENIRSLHNVGSIFRTADGAGWDKIYLCGYTGAPPDRRIEKVSLGAENFVAWEKIESVNEVCEKLKKDGFTICALEQTAKSREILNEKKFPEKLALIVGNEVEGVSTEALENAEIHYEITMHGAKESLNVSIATGIALFIIKK